MLSNSTDKQLPENAVSTSCLPSVFQFSDNRDSESKSLTPHGSYAVYVPDLSYAISVQGLERFIQYREETYRWMLHISADRHFAPDVAYTGMNYFDRYLSKRVIDTVNVELLSWCCLHLASATMSTRMYYLSVKEIFQIVADTYSQESVLQMVNEVLSVLDFHLLPPTPYSYGVLRLQESNCINLIPRFYSIVTNICIRYQSIGILSSCLSRVCVLLTWSFSFPNRRWPNSISCCESVPQKDAERVINLAREVFPMMSLSCDYVLLQLQQSKYHCQELSPTNA